MVVTGKLSVNVQRIVLASTASSLVPSPNAPALAQAGTLGSTMLSFQEKITSSDEKGWPSDHLAPSTRCMVSWWPSSDQSQDFASCGSGSTLSEMSIHIGPVRTRHIIVECSVPP